MYINKFMRQAHTNAFYDGIKRSLSIYTVHVYTTLGGKIE